MTNKRLEKYTNRLVKAFLKNKIISPLPKKFLMHKNLENYVKAKLINRLVVSKQLELVFQYSKN